MAKVPEFVHTPIEKIPQIYNRVHKSFLAHKTRPLEWRLTQLRKLYWGYGISIHQSFVACDMKTKQVQNQGQ
jgi:hypothetical protein